MEISCSKIGTFFLEQPTNSCVVIEFVYQLQKDVHKSVLIIYASCSDYISQAIWYFCHLKNIQWYLSNQIKFLLHVMRFVFMMIFLK
jgi:hypothetical protein